MPRISPSATYATCADAVERQRVVLAQREERDRPLDDLAVRVRRRHAGAPTGTRCAASVAVVAGRRLEHRAQEAARRLAGTGVSRSMPNAVEDLGDVALVARPLLGRDRALAIRFRSRRELNDAQAKPPESSGASKQSPATKTTLREQEPDVHERATDRDAERRTPRAARTCRAARGRRPCRALGRVARGTAPRAGPASRRGRRRRGRARDASQTAGAPRASRSTLKLMLRTAVRATKPAAAAIGLPVYQPSPAKSAAFDEQVALGVEIAAERGDAAR